jgi:hypothetical protein
MFTKYVSKYYILIYIIMFGVVKGVYYCQNDRVEELNRRTYERNIPSQKMQANFDSRPVKTRQVLFPAIDCHQPSNVPIQKIPYNQESQFNPGSSAPFYGYATKIDDDSKLRRQFSPLQKWCDQGEYIPDSRSDMYNTYITPEQEKQTHPLLFKRENFSPFNPNEENLGFNVFNNHSRYQIKNVHYNPKCNSK